MTPAPNHDDARREEHFVRSGDAWDDYDPSRGAVFVSGHFGNWELFAVALQRYGIGVDTVARRLGSGRLARWLDRFRKRHGIAVIDKRNALPLSLRALRANRNVAFLNDQAAGRHGIAAPFFGRDVSTFPAPVMLARKAGVPVYCGYSTRLGDGIRYRCHAETVSREGDAETVTRRLNDILGGYVRDCPEQWWWFHRRFKELGRDRRQGVVDAAGRVERA